MLPLLGHCTCIPYENTHTYHLHWQMYSSEPSYPQIGMSHSDTRAVIRLTETDGFLVSLGPGVISQLFLLSPNRFSSAPWTGVLMGPLWCKECIQHRCLFQHLGASWLPLDSNVGLPIIPSIWWHTVDTASLQYIVDWCHREQSSAMW